MTRIRVLAPAKINLGLAVLGRRPDGYHEIDTIMVMIDLCDEIVLKPLGAGDIRVTGMDNVPVEENIVTKAIRAWNKATATNTCWRIDIIKRIPSPAGLGGGSSDAAAVLRALNTWAGNPLTQESLHGIAASLGADCPFFLGDPLARATGIGILLTPLPPVSAHVVLAVPTASIIGKTASLYGALTPSDYGSKLHIDTIEETIRIDSALDQPLPNSFLRPALKMFPGLRELHEHFSTIAATCSLSGAGPALYAIAPTANEAQRWAEALRAICPPNVKVTTAALLNSPAPIEIVP